tara:strand:+ start:127 stop:1503 length:1377 start_codon:yes stop_codon:yes gene_type:complete
MPSKAKGATGTTRPMKIKIPNSSPENEVGHLLNLACLAATGSPLPSDYFTQDWKYVDEVIRVRVEDCEGTFPVTIRKAIYKSSSKPALYADPFRYASVNGLEQQIKRRLITDEIKTIFNPDIPNPIWFILDILLEDIDLSSHYCAQPDGTTLRVRHHRTRGIIRDLEALTASDIHHENWTEGTNDDDNVFKVCPISQDIRRDIYGAYHKIKAYLPNFSFYRGEGAAISASQTEIDKARNDLVCMEKMLQHNQKITCGASDLLWTPIICLLSLCKEDTKDAVFSSIKGIQKIKDNYKIKSLTNLKNGGPRKIRRQISNKVCARDTYRFPSIWFGDGGTSLPERSDELLGHLPIFPQENYHDRSFNSRHDFQTRGGYVKVAMRYWVPDFWCSMRDWEDCDSASQTRSTQVGHSLWLRYQRRDPRKVWNYVKDCSSTPEDFVNYNPKGWENRFANNLISCY